MPGGKITGKSKKIKAGLVVLNLPDGQMYPGSQAEAMEEMEKKKDLCERLFEFSVAVTGLLKNLPSSPENKAVRSQLSKGVFWNVQIRGFSIRIIKS
jgi:hypothetical protein